MHAGEVYCGAIWTWSWASVVALPGYSSHWRAVRMLDSKEGPSQCCGGILYVHFPRVEVHVWVIWQLGQNFDGIDLGRARNCGLEGVSLFSFSQELFD